MRTYIHVPHPVPMREKIIIMNINVYPGTSLLTKYRKGRYSQIIKRYKNDI